MGQYFRKIVSHKEMIQFVLMTFWFLNMLGSSSYAVVSVLYFGVGIFTLNKNTEKKCGFVGWRRVVAILISALFGFAAVLANYDVFEVYGLLTKSVILLGGSTICWNFLRYWCEMDHGMGVQSFLTAPAVNTKKLFLVAFFSILVLNLSFLYLVEYPGTVTADSMWQIGQAAGVNNYNNWHPICHTLVIEGCLKLGYAIFGNYNDAVGLYTVCQILFLAFAFSYAIATLQAAGVATGVLFAAACVYVLAPYNIVYSVTVWKDVVFGGMVLLFVTSLYALTMEIGKKRWFHAVVLLISSIGFGVMRTNGFYALVVSFLLCAFFYRKRWEILLPWLLGIIVSWFLRGPLEAWLNVSEVDMLEALSIPLQQVARVVVEGRDIYDGERGLIDTVISFERIPDLYLPYLSDPIKDAIRNKDLAYFEENTLDYLKLWVKLGLRYPLDYIKAWVDQTKGYWNGGYDYWVMAHEVYENSLGIVKTVQHTPLAQWIGNILYNTENMPVLHLLFSIGHHVWLIVLLFVCNFLLGKKEALIAIPVIMIVGTLVIATPVFSEFRYAYSVFTTYPFILAISWPRAGILRSDMHKRS